MHCNYSAHHRFLRQLREELPEIRWRLQIGRVTPGSDEAAELRHAVRRLRLASAARLARNPAAGMAAPATAPASPEVSSPATGKAPLRRRRFGSTWFCAGRLRGLVYAGFRPREHGSHDVGPVRAFARAAEPRNRFVFGSP